MTKLKTADVTIYETKEYDKFLFSSKNRKVNQKHVKNLEKTITDSPELGPHKPVNVYPDPKDPDKYRIIDGQHTYEARKNQGLPIYFTIVEGGTIRMAATLNSTRENWRLSEWLHHYCERGLKNYKGLRSIIDTYPFPLYVAISFSENKTTSNSYAARQFKDGKLKSSEFDDLKQLGSELQKLSDIIDDSATDTRNFCFNSRFIEAYISCRYHSRYDAFDPDRFATQVSRYPHVFLPQVNIEDFKRMIEQVYNYNKGAKSSARFF